MHQTRLALFTVSVVSWFLIVIFGALPPVLSASAGTGEDLARITANLPFSMSKIAIPVIPARSVKVTDFGAIGDEAKLNTSAFADAINAMRESGGGRVVVPQGIWLTGPIRVEGQH